jgi:hypothetical protein
MIDATQPILIDPDAYYHAGAIALALDVPLSALDRARRHGELRYVRRGNRILIRGDWVIDWLTPRESEVAHAD